ncbi:MAG: 3-hydroxyacyl-CoA dehydrogenase NAD-binding domain-containing protein [Steroidobacteraceae bacterium]|jgi:3-hydroxyacyl-CoA dehydrogenase/enoyl-CoA hydratase/3-hydroxybutyryl-CoA epimerase|nr:3-hydroxyacyl-CoA dehydrogenase NAD-binding domain-containing protein [Steroidobacteraceae bacterium]
MERESAWRLRRDGDGLAWLLLDKPGASTNVLSRDVLVELDACLAGLERDPPRGLVLRSAKAGGFVAGADIKEFDGLDSVETAYGLVRGGQRVLDRLEALPFPTVAALHGFALGGGLELALACRYRVAVGDERLALGLPEVQLGIHPGFGGTVRAVRLLGVRSAMDLMLTGRTVRADKAAQLGLADRLVADEAALESAARELVARAPPPRRPALLERALSWPLVRRLLRPSILAPVRARARAEHYPAPFAIVDLWARHGARGVDAYEAEARSIARLFLTETSRNLVRVFLLQDRLKALGGKPGSLQRVHVVGAGVMGGDIAAWCAARGLEVTLQDRREEWVAPALARARAFFERRLRDPARAAEAATRLRADVAGEGVATADVVIEAIFENLEAKRSLYADLEPRLAPQALLATNTSSIALEPLAERLQRPGRLVGLHFFNPVAQMPLVEVVHSPATEPAALALALAFARRIDKLPLPCRSSPGFLVNRVLVPYLFEAMHAAAEGVPLAVIDRAALDFGMPMGPVELADVVGLDVCRHVGRIVAEALGRRPPDLAQLEERVAAGKLGRKSGEGFYAWADGKALKPPAGDVAPPPELADRLVLALLNECVACLREGLVEDADLVDAGIVFGAGFAPFRGGPLHYARRRGVPAVVARLRELEARHGARFAPDPGWERLA